MDISRQILVTLVMTLLVCSVFVDKSHAQGNASPQGSLAEAAGGGAVAGENDPAAQGAGAEVEEFTPEVFVLGH
ncbi:hypothetical protein DM860_002892 [Cuscuta australis]|uniref:Uncharacterized protein n=1 Tax=Cuscuta australis TaxID=267555 RepID=A0A328D4Q1_9ASTE|nr:hypothetical protein DM860_002892 [Cuscuta australis]